MTDLANENQGMQVDKALELFSTIENLQQVSQSHLATRLGVAVGLANAYIKRCVKKGWIKVQKVPSRRYAYFLTPKGFVEKSRLTAEYLSHSLGFFRRARNQCADMFQEAQTRGCRRFVLYGLGDLAEIAILAAMECGADISAVVAPGANRERIAGIPLIASLSDAGDFDAVMVTDITAPQEAYNLLRGRVERKRILLPPVLHVIPVPEDQ